MKSIIVILLSFFSITLNAQNMEQINARVTQLFVSTDQGNWPEVENCFANQVVLDYSSMSGNPAATMSPKDITGAWKTILPGFEHTHHQLGNFLTEVEGNTAKVFCYGTATHYLTDEAGNVWTVVGSYDFELKQEANTWKVTSMKFNFKYQDGNASLAQKAIARASN